MPEALRLKAIEMIHNRVLGAPKQLLDMDVSGPLKHEQVIEEVTIRRDELSDASWDDVVDAELIDGEPPTGPRS